MHTSKRCCCLFAIEEQNLGVRHGKSEAGRRGREEWRKGRREGEKRKEKGNVGEAGMVGQRLGEANVPPHHLSW